MTFLPLRAECVDPQGKSIAGADVTLNNTATGLTKSAKTDSNGDYKFAGLPITDNYVVKVEASGFKPAEQQNIVLRANQAAVVEFHHGGFGSANPGDGLWHSRIGDGRFGQSHHALRCAKN